MAQPLNQVELQSEKIGTESSYLSALIKESGELVFEGQDLGPLCEQMLGDFDYEYWYTLSPAWKDHLLLQLLADRFKGCVPIREYLESHGIEFRITSY